MQNWEAMPSAASYEQHNAWYSSMFAANIKQEPGTVNSSGASSQHDSPLPSPLPSTTQLEQYLKQQHQQQQQQVQQQHQAMTMDTLAAMTPSPSNNDNNSLQHYFEAANGQGATTVNTVASSLQQQFLQQQQYQQHFQQAQQVAAQQQDQLATGPHHQVALGFNPLTPPGLPNAMLPFYASMRPGQQQTPSPQPSAATAAVAALALDVQEKLQSALTPRSTPPMDITPPKSPKTVAAGCAIATNSSDSNEPEKEHDQMSNSSEDMKYIAESEDDDTTIRKPLYNSHGKMKSYKCKTCGFVAYTKVDHWNHSRIHMKPEKMLDCPKCPFVTEFKHHLEYHILKHKNQKPFRCDKCSYTCVNKSMLNSHRKSHSSVFQYRCESCGYATKYCHSFKKHLRKEGHKPGIVLDEDGTPNPSLIIDVYGTRRGPKNKSGSISGSSGKRSSANQPHKVELKLPTATLQSFSMSTTQASAAPVPPSPTKSNASVELSNVIQQQQQQANNLSTAASLASIFQQNPNMALLPYWNLNLQMLAAQQQAAALAQLSPQVREQLQQHHQQQLSLANQAHDCPDSEDEEHENDEELDRKSMDSAMDLSQGTPTKEEEVQLQQQTPDASNLAQQALNLKMQDDETPLMGSSTASRRKGRVIKLDTLHPDQAKTIEPEGDKPQEDDQGSGDESMDMANNLPSNGVQNTSASSTTSSSGNSSNASNVSSNASTESATAAPAPTSTGSDATSLPEGDMHGCKYCYIYFKDAVLYTIHMGYHSCDDVFKCNMCGEKCDGPVGLFVHISRKPHS